MFTVYVLRSNTSGRIYIGQTANLEKRLIQHNDPGFDKRSYTKLSGREWSVIYKEDFRDRKSALQREKELKSFRGRNFIRTSIGPVAQR